MGKENVEHHCYSCGHKLKTVSPSTGLCMNCGMTYKIGDTELKVEGQFSEEVKDVASHLVKQINEAKKSENEFIRNQKLQKELKKDKLKHLFVVGGFWIGVFLGLGYFIFQISTSQIQWYKFIILLFVLPIFFTLVGAFILKTTEALKEENFMKLVTMALKINLSGLKSLTKTKQKNSK